MAAATATRTAPLIVSLSFVINQPEKADQLNHCNNIGKDDRSRMQTIFSISIPNYITLAWRVGVSIISDSDAEKDMGHSLQHGAGGGGALSFFLYYYYF